MDISIIEEKILSIITMDLGIKDAALNSNLSVVGIDSITMMTLFVYIEETFNFSVDEEILISNRLITVNDIVAYINEKVN